MRFRGKSDGKERGLATHAFLERLDLDQPLTEENLRAQAQDLVSRQRLGSDQLEAIQLKSVALFWNSQDGIELLATKEEIKRELPFTFKLTAADLRAGDLGHILPIPEDEFVVVQGVADLVRISRHEIWLIDFKTDALKPSELIDAVDRYCPQLALYAMAFSSIYARPVTR